MEKITKTMLETADELLSRANNELCKPQEDVVHYSVCQHAYNAIVNYLGSFLLENGADFDKSSNVANLLSSCRAIDNRFNELHLVLISIRSYLNIMKKSKLTFLTQVKEAMKTW